MPPKECLVWVPSYGVDFSLNKVFFDYFQKLCNTVSPMYLAGRSVLESEGVVADVSLFPLVTCRVLSIL